MAAALQTAVAKLPDELQVEQAVGDRHGLLHANVCSEWRANKVRLEWMKCELKPDDDETQSAGRKQTKPKHFTPNNRFDFIVSNEVFKHTSLLHFTVDAAVATVSEKKMNS